MILKASKCRTYYIYEGMDCSTFIRNKTLQCPDSHVKHSARDVVARVVRPQGIGIAASRDAARIRCRRRGRRRDRRGVASCEMGRAARRRRGM